MQISEDNVNSFFEMKEQIEEKISEIHIIAQQYNFTKLQCISIESYSRNSSTGEDSIIVNFSETTQNDWNSGPNTTSYEQLWFPTRFLVNDETEIHDYFLKKEQEVKQRQEAERIKAEKSWRRSRLLEYKKLQREFGDLAEVSIEELSKSLVGINLEEAQEKLEETDYISTMLPDDTKITLPDIQDIIIVFFNKETQLVTSVTIPSSKE